MNDRLTLLEFKKQYYVHNFDLNDYKVECIFNKNEFQSEINQLWKNRQDIRLNPSGLTYTQYCEDMANGENFNDYDDNVVMELLTRILQIADRDNILLSSKYIRILDYDWINDNDIYNYYIYQIDFENHIVTLIKE